jgi:hypothetical protein
MHCRENVELEVGDATKCGETARVAAGWREMQGMWVPDLFFARAIEVGSIRAKLCLQSKREGFQKVMSKN